MKPASVLMTAEELLAHPPLHVRSELVRGRLIVREPASWRHGDVAARLLMAIGNHLAAERKANGWTSPRGRVVAAETGFTLQRNPDTVRAPDVAYIREDRWRNLPDQAFADIAPDLAVEVLSPSDRPGAVRAKAADWLNAGSALVWTIDPARRLAHVYRADGSESECAADQVLDGEDVIPGLRIHLADMID